MTDTDPGAATAGGRLVEAAKKGGRAVTRAAGKVADVALSVVRGGSSGSSGDETAAAAAAARDAARGGLELVRRTAAPPLWGVRRGVGRGRGVGSWWSRTSG